MHRLDTHADALGELRYADRMASEVCPKVHAGIITTMVNFMQPPFSARPSPNWRWNRSPAWRLYVMPNRIRELRLARGMSQQEVADAAGTTVQQISRLERSERRLAEDWMRRIAPALGVQPAALLTDSAPNPGTIAEQTEQFLLWRFWKLLTVEEKKMIAEYARSKGLDILGNKPKGRRRA